MKVAPVRDNLKKYIDHYWIVKDAAPLFGNSPLIRAYPGVTPEIIMVLDGHYTLHYLGRTKKLANTVAYTFIHEGVQIDFSQLNSFVLIQFKKRALSSFLPFVNYSAGEIMKNSTCGIEELFDAPIRPLVDHLKVADIPDTVDALDSWFSAHLREGYHGFLGEMAEELKEDCSPKNILSVTNYSYSTLERYFKKETGLTPKGFQTLVRFKLATEELYNTHNQDWIHYVNKYKYFDQSHFIKEIKRFTGFTPSQLLDIPGLISYRPQKSDEFLQ
ncbi:MAG: AraC family transcriptional regulator [Bacteroidota bacterium]